MTELLECEQIGPSREEEETPHLTLVMEPFKWHVDRFPQASSIESGFPFFFFLPSQRFLEMIGFHPHGGGVLSHFPLFCVGVFCSYSSLHFPGLM